jgi:hypothetical protein
MVTRWDQDNLTLAHTTLGRTVYAAAPHARRAQSRPRRPRHLRRTSRTLRLTPVRKVVGDVLDGERSREKIRTRFGGGRVLSSLPYSDLTRLVKRSLSPDSQVSIRSKNTLRGLGLGGTRIVL